MKHTTLRARSGVSLMLIGVGCWVGSGNMALAAPVFEQLSGHTDIGVTYENGELVQHYHFGGDALFGDNHSIGSGYPDAPSTYYVDPTQAYIRLKDNANVSLPSGALATYGFTGVTAADPDLWLIPLSQDPNIPWVGLATDAPSLPSTWGTSPIDFSLLSMNFTPFGSADPARAAMSMWTTGVFGAPSVIWDTLDGIQSGPTDLDTYARPDFGWHAHFNWGFTEPGLYEVALEASGTHPVDGFKSSVATYYFAVGNDTPGPSLGAPVPEPASAAIMGAGLATLGLVSWRKRRFSRTEESPEGD